MATRRVLTGMRTTGALHLGHYVGALKNWKEMQDRGEHECFFLLADVQALTTHAEKPQVLVQSVQEVVMDWLSVGLDPSLPNVHFVLQSQIAHRSELSILLCMVTPHALLMRNPTLKTELDSQSDATVGFMMYPVDQAADIYCVSPTPPEDGDELLVPTGDDQSPILELTREIGRRFNKAYGRVFVPCGSLFGDVGRLVGTDGQAKMSKSLGNTINLSDDVAAVAEAVRRMKTDPTGLNPRLRATDPGVVEGNPIFLYHDTFNSDLEEVDDLKERYLAGRVSDQEVKARLVVAINDFLDPIRDRRAQFADADLREIVAAGTEVASKNSTIVIERVRELMHLQYPR